MMSVLFVARVKTSIQYKPAWPKPKPEFFKMAQTDQSLFASFFLVVEHRHFSMPLIAKSFMKSSEKAIFFQDSNFFSTLSVENCEHFINFFKYWHQARAPPSRNLIQNSNFWRFLCLIQKATTH